MGHREVGMVCSGGASGIEKGRKRLTEKTKTSWGHTEELRLWMIELKL